MTTPNRHWHRITIPRVAMQLMMMFTDGQMLGDELYDAWWGVGVDGG